MTMRLDADAVRALLTPRMVLDHFEIKRSGSSQLATSSCPQCGQLKRASVSIHPETGLWKCYHCGTGGGVLALAAGYAGIDIHTDFYRALGLAAAIAGIPRGVDDEDYAQLLAESKKRREEFAAREKEARARSVARMPWTWSLLDQRSFKGESYLRGRNIDPDALRALDLVRYRAGGDPGVALRDLSTGKIVGIQYRCLSGDVKLICSPGSQVTGSALVGCLGDLDKRRVAVLVEGLADSLVARLLWPDAAIFGAPGAGQLEGIAKAVAPEVVKQGGILILVPDNDEVGTKAGARAVIAAQDAGLELAESAAPGDARKILIADLGDHHDLAAAWTCGYWQWAPPPPLTSAPRMRSQKRIGNISYEEAPPCAKCALRKTVMIVMEPGHDGIPWSLCSGCWR